MVRASTYLPHGRRYGRLYWDETSATHAPDHLFDPGSYTLAVWNPAEEITVNGTTATVAAATGNDAVAGAFISNAPGWLFTSVQQVLIEKDTDYR